MNTDLFSISVPDLERMRIEFPENWEKLFINAYQRFSIESKLKIVAIKHCEKEFKKHSKRSERLQKTLEERIIRHQKDNSVEDEDFFMHSGKDDIIDHYSKHMQPLSVKQIDEEVNFKEA